MTWAEFLIRLHAYKRLELKEWAKTREIAWASLIGSHQNPKKLPKDIEAFMPLYGRSKGKVTEKMRERMKEAVLEFQKGKKNG